MADPVPFVQCGMAPELAVEVARQIGGVQNAGYLIGLGMPADLATELARQIFYEIPNVGNLVGLGLPVSLAAVVAAAILAAAPDYAPLFATATLLSSVAGISGNGVTDCTAGFNSLSASKYYIGDGAGRYRLNGQWTPKTNQRVWFKGATLDMQYSGTGTSAVVNGSASGVWIFDATMGKPSLAYGGRLIGVSGNDLVYRDLRLITFDSGGIAVFSDNVSCRDIYLNSGKVTTGNFGIRDFGGVGRSYVNIEGYTGDDMIAIATGPAENDSTSGVVISGIRGRSYAARLIAVDLIDQDVVGGLTCDIAGVTISDVLGTSWRNAITIRNLDSPDPHEINGVSLTNVDITLSDPGPAGQIATRPLSIIGQLGYVRNVTTSNVVLRNTINQNVSPSGLTSGIDVSGVTCV